MTHTKLLAEAEDLVRQFFEIYWFNTSDMVTQRVWDNARKITIKHLEGANDILHKMQKEYSRIDDKEMRMRLLSASQLDINHNAQLIAAINTLNSYPKPKEV